MQAPLLGYTCSYAPLPLLHAAGYQPYRLLPNEQSPERAGGILHDNLCPHVKRVLDRALADDLPPMAGLVVMNSCETMRRLWDAWRQVRPDSNAALVELPLMGTSDATNFFANELRRLADVLQEWGGQAPSADRLLASMDLYNTLATTLSLLGNRLSMRTLPGGRAALQRIYLAAMISDPQQAIVQARALEAEPEIIQPSEAVPVYILGNMLWDPQVFTLFEECGLAVVGDDLCTGSRLLQAMAIEQGADPYISMADALLHKVACARTINPAIPVSLAEQAAFGARFSGARAVVIHVLKFCDPYLGRIPAIRKKLQDEGLPCLVLESDGTSRAIGQQRTRLQAFAETLGGV